MPASNDIIIFEHGVRKQHLVKRINLWPSGELVKEGLWYVTGDNRRLSQDSRYFGGIATQQILGEVKLILTEFNKKKPTYAKFLLSPAY